MIIAAIAYSAPLGTPAPAISICQSYLGSSSGNLSRVHLSRNDTHVGEEDGGAGDNSDRCDSTLQEVDVGSQNL
jgi:hypothetical protein